MPSTAILSILHTRNAAFAFAVTLVLLSFPVLFRAGVTLCTSWRLWSKDSRLDHQLRTTMFSVLVPAVLGLCLGHSTASGQTCMTISNDDGEPGVFNVTVPNDFSDQNVSIPFDTSKSFDLSKLAVGGSYQVILQADGGFASYTISLNSDFVFSDGSNQESGYIISFFGPVTYSFKRIDSKSCQGLTITDTPLPTAEPGAAYSHTFSVTGGVPPYTWSSSYTSLDPNVSGPGTPLAFTLDPSGGTLTGAGQHSELYQLTVSVQDSLQAMAQHTFPFSVDCSAQDMNTDTDQDGLPDCWEQYGKVFNGTLVDLPAMGSDPMHKDIFVQADYMYAPYGCTAELGCGDHSHYPEPEVIDRLMKAFAAAPLMNPDKTTGINLHIDCGPSCVMTLTKSGTAVAWGALSKARSFQETDANTPLGYRDGIFGNGPYDFHDFDNMLRNVSFVPTNRQNVFHYMVFAHALGGLRNSGISRDAPAADFIVSLGYFKHQTGEVGEQEGTFMHELGHNLSLQHGGNEENALKPNYLSVMNYLFQFDGITKSGKPGTLDYSHFVLPSLNKLDLNEHSGLSGGPDVSAYGTAYACLGPIYPIRRVMYADQPIDWNCDGMIEAGVKTDIDAGGTPKNQINETLLKGYTDWSDSALIFKGGSIGKNGAEYVPASSSSETEEMTPELDKQIGRTFEVAVSCDSAPPLTPGSSTIVACTIQNLGSDDDTYTITPTSSLSWISTVNIPSSIFLTSQTTTTVNFTLSVPADVATGTTGYLRLKAVSASAPLIEDIAVKNIDVSAGLEKTSTTTIVSINPSINLVAGEKLNATVVVKPTSGSVIPTGTITLADPDSPHTVTVPLGSDGTAVYETTVPAPGMYKLYATYNGSANLAGSTSPTLSATVK